jgi:hypothetical protein
VLQQNRAWFRFWSTRFERRPGIYGSCGGGHGFPQIFQENIGWRGSTSGHDWFLPQPSRIYHSPVSVYLRRFYLFSSFFMCKDRTI